MWKSVFFPLSMEIPSFFSQTLQSALTRLAGQLRQSEDPDYDECLCLPFRHFQIVKITHLTFLGIFS